MISGSSRSLTFRVPSRQLCVALLCWAATTPLGSQPAPASQAELEAAEKAARQALEGFFEAFNSADNEALQQYCNYPHAFVGAAGSIRVVDHWEMDFDALRAREGWRESTLDSVRAFLVKPDKVHFEIVFSRHKEDGTVYRTVPGLWIMTLQEGRWGLSLRSY